MTGNAYLSEPCIVTFEHSRWRGPTAPHLDRIFDPDNPEPVSGSTLPAAAIASLEYYLRTLLAASASEIVIPAPPATAWASPRRLKGLLASTLAKRVHFVDRDEATWTSVRRYFRPMTDTILRDDSDPWDGGPLLITEVAWALYQLLLAYKRHAELNIDLAGIMRSLDRLLSRRNLTAEAGARLAVLRGMFASYDQQIQLPTFVVVASSDSVFGERLEEILDDAHFLEVTTLRRFFGASQNKRAIARDLRKLISFIVRNKHWAKGAVSAGTGLVRWPSHFDKSAAHLLDGLQARSQGSPTITTRFDAARNRPFWSVIGRRSIYGGEWYSTPSLNLTVNARIGEVDER